MMIFVLLVAVALWGAVMGGLFFIVKRECIRCCRALAGIWLSGRVAGGAVDGVSHMGVSDRWMSVGCVLKQKWSLNEIDAVSVACLFWGWRTERLALWFAKALALAVPLAEGLGIDNGSDQV
jgi:hypothetical protein